MIYDLDAMSTPLNVKLILGSTREQRFGDKVAHWMQELAKPHANLDVELLDLRDYPMPFFNEAISPSMVQGYYANEVVERFTRKIEEGDAFIFVTPEYNHGYSAVLKNALDYVYKGWNQKAVAMVSYGGVGGARAIEQLRLVTIELQMAPIRNAVHIHSPWAMTDEAGNLKAGALDSYVGAAEKCLEQLAWWGNALKTARAIPNPSI